MTPAVELADSTGKVFLRITADAIWVAPGCNADVAARRFLSSLHQQIRAIIDFEVAKLMNDKIKQTDVDEPAKVCPQCGSDDVSIYKQTENNEVVCAADHCNWCGHEWNVG